MEMISMQNGSSSPTPEEENSTLMMSSSEPLISKCQDQEEERQDLFSSLYAAHFLARWGARFFHSLSPLSFLCLLLFDFLGLL